MYKMSEHYVYFILTKFTTKTQYRGCPRGSILLKIFPERVHHTITVLTWVLTLYHVQPSFILMGIISRSWKDDLNTPVCNLLQVKYNFSGYPRYLLTFPCGFLQVGLKLNYLPGLNNQCLSDLATSGPWKLSNRSSADNVGMAHGPSLKRDPAPCLLLFLSMKYMRIRSSC